MEFMTWLISAAKFTLVASVFAVAPVTATVTSASHTPKINTHWYYTVQAMQDGKPAAGTLTAKIVDPVGGVHPVVFGSTTKPITNLPFKGSSRNFIIWPVSSRGIPLKVRVVVKVGTTKRTISYAVTPR
jgi:hypothetical protein